MRYEKNSTPEACAALACFVYTPEEWLYGYLIIKATGLKGGTVYPLLRRLEKAGFLASRPAPAKPGYPPRKAYRLRLAGVEHFQMLKPRFPEVTVDREVFGAHDE